MVEQEQIQTPEKSVFKGLEGVYRGLMPTDQSNVRKGELELTIQRDALILRAATDWQIDKISLSLNDISEMSRQEVSSLLTLKKLTDDAKECRAFKLAGEPFLLFHKEKKEDSYISLFPSELIECLGPTPLYSPKQVERGLFKKVIDKVKRVNNRGLPRLDPEC